MNLNYILKTHKVILILSLIVLIGIFLRTYQAIERFDFAHDGDLYSWIVKDIVVNKHLRLIGQVTSTEGIFIGPFFYYSLVPFFLITNMEPTGGIILVTLISVATIFSFYFVFAKLFDKTTGLIAALVQAIFLTRVLHDRWVVPTNTTSLWEIWYFYSILMLARGNFIYFPLVGFLVGMIWHISFSEAPILALIPLSLVLSKKLPKIKELALGLIGFLIPSIPLMLFEYKHNFIQSKSFINSFLQDQGGGKGIEKLIHVLSEVNYNITGLLFYPYRGNFPYNVLVVLLLILLSLFLVRKKAFQKKDLLILLSWIFLMISFFSLSTKAISEYYFSNLDMVFLSIMIVGLAIIFKYSKILKIFCLLVFSFLILQNSLYIITSREYNHLGYLERKYAVEYIKMDSLKKNYPCIGISYIAKVGDNVGFRYLFYLNNIKIKKPSNEIPVYNLVLPHSLSNESDIRFGNIGLISQKKLFSKKDLEKICMGPDENLSDSLLGFVQ
ncbi:hypothetical protein HY025_00045 [Candidatus Daviesbacteria bacterium]|nr:hypothetical protein [Candidatus Daviesbacteria bacterium]